MEHGHLLFHLPDAWLKGAKLISVSGGLQGGVELHGSTAAALYRDWVYEAYDRPHKDDDGRLFTGRYRTSYEAYGTVRVGKLQG